MRKNKQQQQQHIHLMWDHSVCIIIIIIHIGPATILFTCLHFHKHIKCSRRENARASEHYLCACMLVGIGMSSTFNVLLDVFYSFTPSLILCLSTSEYRSINKSIHQHAELICGKAADSMVGTATRILTSIHSYILPLNTV